MRVFPAEVCSRSGVRMEAFNCTFSSHCREADSPWTCQEEADVILTGLDLFLWVCDVMGQTAFCSYVTTCSEWSG